MSEKIQQVELHQNPESNSEANLEPLTGYELVADMMLRQDAVIAELDILNGRIENAIKDISAARKIEQEALEAEHASSTLPNEDTIKRAA
jgi:hypothetical protein